MDSRPGSLEDASRLDVLRRSGLLDSPAEEAFDRLTRLAARLLGAPISLVSLVDKDRQFFKSAHGLAEPWASRRQTPLTHSFCQYVVTDGPLVVNDAAEHSQLKDNPAIAEMGFRAYLGMPLKVEGSETLGAFSVVDSRPREWTDAEFETVRDLCAAAATEIELRIQIEALKESDARFRDVFDSLHDVYYRTDATGRMTLMSPSSLPHTGYTADEMMGQPASMVFVHREEYLAFVNALFGHGFVNDYEVLLRRKDGTEVPTSINATVIRDEAAAPIGTQGTLRDITKRRGVEDALRASEQHYQMIMDTAGEGIWLGDLERRTVYANPAALAIVGYDSLDEIIGLPLEHFVAPGVPARPPEVKPWRKGTTPRIESQLVRRDGSLVDVLSTFGPYRDAAGNVEGIIAKFTDITELKRVEAERDRIFTSSIDMIAVMTEQGRFIRVNPAWQRTLGYAPAELVGQSLWHFAHPEDRAEGIEQTRGVSEGEDVEDVRFRMRDISGAYRWFSWSVGAASADGRCYAVVRDVTEQVDAETQRSELMAVLEMHAMSLAEQAHEMDRLRIEAEFIANHDGLTGCLNRRAWFERATNGRPTAVAIYDIDDFKKINDTFGHPIGDHVLKEVASRLQRIFDGEASLGRIGGEEFAVLFAGSVEDAVVIGCEVVEVIATTPFVLPDGTELTVTISAGLAPWIQGKHSREESLALTYEAADRALYQAKESGRRRLSVFSEAAESRAA